MLHNASRQKGSAILSVNLIAEASRYIDAALASPGEMMALLSVVVAGGFVLVSSFVKTMIPLRWLAIGSNIGFVVDAGRKLTSKRG